MIFHTSQLIADAFDKKGIKYGNVIEEGPNDQYSYLEPGFTVDNGPFVKVKFFSKGENNDVEMRLFSLIHINDESKIPAVLRALNDCSSQYRFLKFVLDKDNDVNVEYDFLQETSDDCVGAMAVEAFIRTMHIVDKAYPEIMKAMWA